MLHVPASDDSLSPLRGHEVPSVYEPGVVYRIGQPLGEGGMCIAFYALRVAPDGEGPVVLKIVRPSFVRESSMAALVVKKEVVALGRLNERVPPVPFVVRLVDTGVLPIQHGRLVLELPWLIVEYVHGGAEGTTLAERVRSTLRDTGAAFAGARAAHAIDCLTQALEVVHEVGVIHRDIKPDNVLCCGFGADEMFKVADFGVARPAGLIGTFGGTLAGTPGFAPPELIATELGPLTPATDVFSVAPTVYFLLTGEDYFSASTPMQHVASVANRHRRSILAARGLAPTLRAQEERCRGIDVELARASAMQPEQRHQSARELGAMLLRWLPTEDRWPSPRPPDIRPREQHVTPAPSWSWAHLHRPEAGRAFRSVAWDPDGRGLAVHETGLAFWDGKTWRDVTTDKLPAPSGVRFVHRTGPGRWILGGDGGMIASYTTSGVENVIRADEPALSYNLFSGALEDLGVVGGDVAGTPPQLHALVGRRWLKALPVEGAAALTAVARFEPERWLVAAKGEDGRGFVASYAPLNWQLERFVPCSSGAFTAAAGNPDLGFGVVVGPDGYVVLTSAGEVWTETVAGAPHLSAVAIDERGAVWVGGRGTLHRRQPGDSGHAVWECLWEDPAWTAPFFSILAEDGHVLALARDGGLLEGWQLDARSSGGAGAQ
jgi:serine/threonine protein kinase